MAIAHLRITAQSRGKGASVVAKAAYNSGEKLRDLAGTLQDYTRKGGIKYRALVYNPAITEPHESRQEFWQNVEKSEKRKDACLSREFCASLPVELSYEQNLKLTSDWSKYLIQRYDLRALDVAVHYPRAWHPRSKAKAENPHIHALAPDRNRHGQKLNLSRNRNEILELREAWEQICNKHLAAAGVQTQISMRSNKKQIADLDAEIRELQAVEAEIKRELDQIAQQEERAETMTDAQIQYLALLARERADAQTRKTLEEMNKAASIDFYRQNEAILETLYASKYTDADAYARLCYNATRYHLRRIAMDEARRRRDEDETRRNRRQYAAFRSYAKQHAATGQDPRRIAAIMMYRAGASASDIAARLVAGMMDENPAEMGALEMIGEQIGEQIGEALDAVITEALRDRGRWEKLDAEIAKIEDAYADMSLHAPREYQEGMEARKQEAIAAARALAAWQERQERAAQREAQREAQKQQDQPPTPTAKDARIFARHAAQAGKTAPSKEKTNEMIALRLRACGHSADDAMRIMCAGMQPDAAMAAVASMFHSPHGDEMMRIARDRAAQWRREEQGQDTIRRSTGAAQAQKPAAAAAPKPRM